MNFKQIAKYTGKTLATIACPPVGMALWKKEAGTRAFLAYFGVAISAFASVAIEKYTGKKEIYDKPKINITRVANSAPWGFMEFVSSPIAFYLDSHLETKLTKDDKPHYSVKGDDVVIFSNGKYTLNFSPQREFAIEGQPPATTLEKSQKQVRKYEKAVEKFLREGNLFEVRRAKEKLKSAQSDLESTTKRYEETKTAFRDAVINMNSELEIITLEQNQEKEVKWQKQN